MRGAVRASMCYARAMAQKVIDCLGEICPVPVVRAKVALKQARPGDIVIVRTDHSCTMKSLPDLLRQMGYPAAVEEVGVGVWEIRATVPEEGHRTRPGHQQEPSAEAAPGRTHE